jgi:ABC-type uncharacterized transport system involved in gliding motility auxiliary subunit
MVNQNSQRRILQQKRLFNIMGAATMALIITIVVFVTLIAYRLPWAYDLTAGQVFTLSEKTQEVLAALDKPVDIIAIYPQDAANPMIVSLLDQYQTAGSNLKVEYIDAEREPAKLASYDIGAAAISNGMIIVRADEKTKFIYESDLFQDTIEGKAFWGERQLTGAIRYVTASVRPVVYFLEGHEEASLSAELSQAQTALEFDVYDVRPLSLVKTGSVPADAKAVIISSPRQDLSESEYTALETYLLNGGKALFLMNAINTNTMVLANFNRLAHLFGVDISNNLVVEEDPNSHLSNNNLYLIPGYLYHEITAKLAESKRFLIFPIAMGLQVLEVDPQQVKQEALLATSPNAWMRQDLAITSEEKTEQDIAGPIPLAYAVTRASGLGQEEARIVVVGNSTFIYNENLEVNANRDFFINSVNWLTGSRGEEAVAPRIIGADRLMVRGNDFVRLVIITIVLLPAVPFCGAFLIWYVRRNQ